MIDYIFGLKNQSVQSFEEMEILCQGPHKMQSLIRVEHTLHKQQIGLHHRHELKGEIDINGELHASHLEGR